MTARPGGRLVLASAFLSGAAVLVVEIAGARLLSPWFGSGLYAWASTIAVTLLALALGYRLGGRLADRKGAAALGPLLAAAGIACAAAPLLAAVVLRFTGSLEPRSGALLSAALLLGPALALLGAVSPVAAGEAARRAAVGRGIGTAYAVSTMGSLAGALAAGFWLVPWVPLPAVFAGTGVALALGAVPWLGARAAAGGAAAACLLAGGGGLAQPSDATLLERRASLLGEASVHEADGLRWLSIDGRPQSGMTLSDGENPFPYLHVAELAVPAGAERAAVLGTGGGMFSKALERRGVRTDCVEANPAVAELAKRWFEPPCSGGLFVEDARAFLRRAPDRGYDLVLADVFGSEGLPAHLATAEFFQDARRALAPRGVLVFNTIASPHGPRRDVWTSLARTASTVFPEIRVLAAYEPEQEDNNVLILASSRPLDLQAASQRASAAARPAIERSLGWFLGWRSGEGHLLTDARNPIDALNAGLRHRRWSPAP